MSTELVTHPIHGQTGSTDRVRGWCPSPRQGRSLGSKSTYKGNYIYLPPKALAGLEPGFSRIQDLSFYH
ncbi:hypothetical protein MTR_8g054310 [Medicago truncatula]|uniref:Uncharacterized protein n=1 Tax=Medicago truncatula TaxID=3880 RepID=G7LA47_MEDTR|nr:hypothetical protein MTR_8g054310 [Medicago truncatula]